MGDVLDRIVVCDEAVDEDEERCQHEGEDAGGHGTRCAHPHGIFAMRARKAKKRLQRGQNKRDQQRQGTNLRNHRGVPSIVVAEAGALAEPPMPSCRFLSDLATSGGVYFSSCLASTSSAMNTPSCN